MAANALPLKSTNVRKFAFLAALRLRLALASAFAPSAAVETASRLFTTPPRFAHTARELDALASGTRFEVATPFGQVAAWRFGARHLPIVLLSHGWGGRGAQLRAFIPALLEAGYQVVLFDHPGHGHSDGHESTLVHFVAALESVALAVSRDAPIAGLVGHSLGAAAAASWLNRTERRLRAVLIAPPTSLTRHSGYFARKLGLSERIRRAMQERFERRLGHRWSEFELPQSVARVRAEALVIHDAADDEVPVSSGLALARAWPDARFVATTGLGHRAVLRDEVVVRDAVDFLTGRVVFAPPPSRGEARPFGEPAPIL